MNGVPIPETFHGQRKSYTLPSPNGTSSISVLLLGRIYTSLQSGATCYYLSRSSSSEVARGPVLRDAS